MAKSNGLRDLEAFERIEIGPTRVETNRCITPYAVVARGEIHQTELTYKYEEDVFDPASPADRNLAGLIGAQVALNYGLFTRNLVFNDPFDDHDRRFVEEMARGTAREIYVNKLLASNPFLVDGFGPLPAKKLPDFLRARLIFDGSGNAGSKKPAPARWMTSPERYAVLSSGGKDSLLSFGLLREIGREVHPIYVNESGRHWYTALNAYRRFT
ncbi:MAG TPA: creatininase family protein, partial [Polyangia bacterium]|nr:creatininase family protein [Polyangia bacterium]